MHKCIGMKMNKIYVDITYYYYRVTNTSVINKWFN